jgi:hypothetical protein
VEAKMAKEHIQDAVKRVVGDVFQKMYFMFPEPLYEDDPVPSLPEPCFRAKVGIKNSPKVVMLYGSEQLVIGMARNLLGTDQAPEEGDLIDIFREAANVIAGNLIVTLTLERGVRLDIPVAEKMQTCSELETLPGTTFNVDNEFFKLALKE